MNLTLVHVREFACWPWELRFLGEEPARAAICRSCGRDVALPVAHEKERPICLYCSLDSGLLEAVETPLVGRGE